MMGGGTRVPAALALILLLPAPAQAQTQADGQVQDQPVATRTRALRGLAWGASGGALVTGLGFGILAAGLCDRADCSGSFTEGFLVGVLAGGVAGGVAGAVVGSAFPADGRALGERTWTVRAGARLGLAPDVDGIDVSAGVQTLRATTRDSWFGVEVEYLGGADHRTSFGIRDRDGGEGLVRHHRRWRIAGARVVAMRSLGSLGSLGSLDGEPRRGPYLLGSVGLHPTWETVDETRIEGGAVVDQGRWRSFLVLPGAGIGGGGSIPLRGRWSLEVGSRLDAVVGLGSDDIVPLLHLTVSLRRWPGVT